MAALGGVSVVMLGVGAINVLFIPFLVNDLGASPAWAGPLERAQTLSMILAGGLMGGLSTRFSIPRLFVGGITGLALCIGLFRGERDAVPTAVAAAVDRRVETAPVG